MQWYRQFLQFTTMNKEDLIMPRAMLNNLIMAGGAKEVKKLRDATGAGMMDCKKALVDHAGDVSR